LGAVGKEKATTGLPHRCAPCIIMALSCSTQQGDVTGSRKRRRNLPPKDLTGFSLHPNNGTKRGWHVSSKNLSGPLSLTEITMAQRLKYGSYYHIYNRGNNRENIFIEERNYAYFLRLYAEHIVSVADTYAYCLLRNHRVRRIRRCCKTGYVNSYLLGVTDQQQKSASGHTSPLLCPLLPPRFSDQGRVRPRRIVVNTSMAEADAVFCR